MENRLECLSHFTTSNLTFWRLKLRNFPPSFLNKRNLTLIGFTEISPSPPSTRCFRNIKKLYFWFHFRSTEGQTFYLYWSIYNSWWQHQVSVRAVRHDWANGRFSKSRGLSASVSLPFFPTLSPLFYSFHFSRGLWLFAPKPHGNACYAGYPSLGRSQGFVTRSFPISHLTSQKNVCVTLKLSPIFKILVVVVVKVLLRSNPWLPFFFARLAV